MSDSTDLACMCLVALFVAVLGSVHGCEQRERGYRQGQIDALSDPPVIKYELRDNPDNTREWVRRDDVSREHTE